LFQVTNYGLRPKIGEINATIASLIAKCLLEEPQARPTFKQIIEELEGIKLN
jgi:ABC-type Zn2+ transport system substrate-binding protein/surface adhesin